MRKQLIYFYVFSIVFQHFTLFKALDFDFTILFLFNVLVVILFFNKISYQKHFLIISLIFLPLINIITQQYDYIEFFRTYLLFVLWLYSIFIISSLLKTGSINLFVILIKVLSYIGIYSIAQVLFFLLFNSSILFNIFGSHGYRGEFNFLQDMASHIIPRANALFLEPSVNGRMLSLGIALFLYISDEIHMSKIYLLFLIVGLLCSQSASAIIQTSIFTAVWLYFKLPKKSLLFFFPILLGCIVILLYKIGIFHRVSEISVIGTSGYYRITAPLMLIFDIFKSNLFGFPLGSVEKVISEMPNFSQGSLQGSSLDNSIITIIFNFGIIGIIIDTILIFTIVSSIIKKQKEAILGVFLFFTLLGTGALFTPEITVVVIIYILSRKISYAKAKNTNIIYQH